MGKVRVYELAKELGITSKEIIETVTNYGENSVKSHMSVIGEGLARRLREKYTKKGEQVKVQPSAPKVTEQKETEKATEIVKQPDVSQPDMVQKPYQDRPQGQGQRPPYQDRPQGQGQRPPYQDRPQGQGQRPPYQDRPQGQGQRPPYQDRPQGQGQRPPYQDRPQGQGQRPPYQDRPQGQGQRPPYQDRPQGQDQRPPYQGQGQRPPYQDRPQGQGQRPPYQGQGQRPPYQDRPQGQGQRPPYQGQGQRPPYQDRPQGQGQRPPYQGQGQRPPYQDRPQGQGQRPPYQGQGQRPPYQDRPQGQGQRPPYQGQGQRPPGNQGFQNQSRRELSIPKVPDEVKGQIQQVKPKEEIQANKDQKKKFERWEKKFDSSDKNGPAKSGQKQPAKSKRDEGKLNTVQETPKEKEIIVQISEDMTVKEFAEKAKVSVADVIKNLMKLGVMATINQTLDPDTATIVGEELGIKVEIVVPVEDVDIEEIEDAPETLKPRPPVVTIMGHVDHGKTSLLDALRETNVTASEAGGITQHIGAYQVRLNGKKITFLDTPGHEAFTAMRARGAQATDIAILVVAADDGVMPQTIEAINHAKAAKVPVIIAINKIDKPEANPDRVKQELTEHGMLVEEWGGDVIAVPVSAKKKMGLEQLLEMILLVAEMQELKANPDRPGTGVVIEAKLDKGRGTVATMLVQKGTVEIGDTIVVGSTFGKVRAMLNDKSERLDKAGPATPVEILGLPEVPTAGDIFNVVKDDKLARLVTDKRKAKKKEEEQQKTQRVTLEDLFSQIEKGEVKELRVVVKADVHGSTEAVRDSFERLSNDKVQVKVIHGGVGAISESDVMLAAASNAIIIGFNVRPDLNARNLAEKETVDIKVYRVIYEAIEDVKAAMEGLLEPEFKEVTLGHAEVRAIFKASKIGIIFGCYVLDGKIVRNGSIRIVRDGKIMHEGKLDSLKRFKEDAKEVAAGYECGMAFEKFSDIKEGDVIEAFEMQEIPRGKAKE